MVGEEAMAFARLYLKLYICLCIYIPISGFVECALKSWLCHEMLLQWICIYLDLWTPDR